MTARHCLGPVVLCLATLCLLGCAGSTATTPDSRTPVTAASTAAPLASQTPDVTHAAPRGASRPITPRELQVIESLMRDAERVRELRFTRAVDVIVQDAEAIAGYVDSQIEPDKVETAIDIYAALGLIDPALDLRALWLRLMGEQVVGYYDLDRGQLIVRDDVMRAFSASSSNVRKSAPHGSANASAPASQRVNLQEARVVLVHELVHALQDQHLSLAKHMHDELDTDAENALRALVEGDATLAMISHALERESIALSELTRDPARIRGLSQLVSAPMKGTELDTAPAIVRVSLLSAYVQGLMFVAALHGSGGFARINRAYADPPVSTEHVLHPQRFARGEQPERIRLPQAETLLGEGYPLVAEDTIGELEMSVYFAQGMSEPLAGRAADGWGGDRLYAFKTASGERAAVWVSSWDNERQAIEAERAAHAVRAASEKPARDRHGIERSGRTLLIAREVPADRFAALRERFLAWVSRAKGALASATDTARINPLPAGIASPD